MDIQGGLLMRKLIANQNSILDDSWENEKIKNINEFLKEIGFEEKSILKGVCGNISYYNKDINMFVPQGIDIPKDSIIFLHYPCNYLDPITIEILKSTKEDRQNKIVTLVHQLNIFSYDLNLYNDVEFLNGSDYVFVHTNDMGRFLKKNGLKSETIPINGFDYYVEGELKERKDREETDKYSVDYICDTRSDEDYILSNFNRMRMKNYYVNYYSAKRGTGGELAPITDIRYLGKVDYKNVYKELSGDFGIVYPMCNTKLSDEKSLKLFTSVEETIYILNGMPLIVFSDNPNASFIKKEGIGIVVNSLKDIDESLGRLSNRRYNEMRRKVNRIRDKYSRGFYIKRAMENLESML